MAPLNRIFSSCTLVLFSKRYIFYCHLTTCVSYKIILGIELCIFHPREGVFNGFSKLVMAFRRRADMWTDRHTDRQTAGISHCSMLQTYSVYTYTYIYIYIYVRIYIYIYIHIAVGISFYRQRQEPVTIIIIIITLSLSLSLSLLSLVLFISRAPFREVFAETLTAKGSARELPGSASGLSFDFNYFEYLNYFDYFNYLNYVNHVNGFLFSCIFIFLLIQTTF